MAAEPIEIEDPNDPQAILRDLPDRERGEFLRQYHQAVEAAHDLSGYHQLRRLLHVWRLTAIACHQGGYYEDLDAVRSGVARSVPADEVISDWNERLAAARITR
jgi:hypothetical protein